MQTRRSRVHNKGHRSVVAGEPPNQRAPARVERNPRAVAETLIRFRALATKPKIEWTDEPADLVAEIRRIVGATDLKAGQ